VEYHLFHQMHVLHIGEDGLQAVPVGLDEFGAGGGFSLEVLADVLVGEGAATAGGDRHSSRFFGSQAIAPPCQGFPRFGGASGIQNGCDTGKAIAISIRKISPPVARRFHPANTHQSKIQNPKSKIQN